MWLFFCKVMRTCILETCLLTIINTQKTLITLKHNYFFSFFFSNRHRKWPVSIIHIGWCFLAVVELITRLLQKNSSNQIWINRTKFWTKKMKIKVLKFSQKILVIFILICNNFYTIKTSRFAQFKVFFQQVTAYSIYPIVFNHYSMHFFA